MFACCGSVARHKRNPQRVLRDVRDGLVSREVTREWYGVAITDDGREVIRQSRGACDQSGFRANSSDAPPSVTARQERFDH